MLESYQKKNRKAHSDGEKDPLEEWVREGARRMLAMALEEEVNAFLGRDRYQRGQEFRGYRNGFHPKRAITVGLGPVEVHVPRVSEVPPQVEPNGFQSRIVLKYQRATEAIRKLFARLYLEGLATGDFEPAFRELTGETTALSASAIVRLKQC